MNSLKSKTFLTLFLVQVVTFTFFLYFYHSVKLDNEIAEYKLEKDVLMFSLLSEAKTALRDNSFEMFYSRLEALVTENEISDAHLLDKSGEIVVDFQSKEKTIVEKNPVIAISKTMPIKINNSNAGSLVVEYSVDDIARLSENLINKHLSVFLVALLLFVVSSYLFASMLTLRFNKIIHTADFIAEGHYHSRTEEFGKDDIARLGMAFDSILAHIESDRKHSREYEKELEDRVSARTHDLEIANEENRAFAISVTQDLRDPLRRLKSYVQVLQEDYRDSVDQDGKHVIDRIQFNSRELNRLIDSLLQLTRAGHQELNRRSVNFSGMVKDVVKHIAEQHPQHVMHTRVQPDLMVYADGLLLRRVVENLVENAWKFTRHSKHPLLEVGVKFDNHPIYYFKDNGVGFNPDYEDRLFIPFQRLHQDKEYHGVGIGLSTTQHIIHRHGGEIWADSKPGEGATFYFTMPDEKSASVDAA